MTKLNRSMKMTEGVIWRQILAFAIPLILAEMFQTFYNTADSLIVGNFIGKAALAAVGSTANIVIMIVGFFVGFSTGTTVVIAQYFGAGDADGVSRAVHTSILFTLYAGITLTLVGFFGTPTLLRILKTPDDVFPQAKLYLQIYFSGMIGRAYFNVISAILRAVGDSRTSLRVLAVSSALNIALDMLLIYYFHMGIAGAAIATVFSELFTAAVLFYRLVNTDGVYRLCFKKLSIDGDILKRIINIGLPQAIQKIIINFSNLIVLSYINRFGTDAMTGWSIHQRLDMMINRTVQSLESASTAFVGQNVGAKKHDRVHKGIKVTLVIALLLTAGYALLFVCGRKFLINLFSRDEGVMYYGCTIICLLVPAYVLHAYNHVQAGALRGYGESKAPTLIMIISTVLMRQLYLTVGWHFCQTIQFALSSYIFSWLSGFVGFSWYSSYRRRKRGF